MQSRPYHIHRGLFFIITQPQQTTNQTKLSDRFASGDRFASAASFFVCGDVMMRAWASARPCMAYCSAAEQKKKQHRLRRGAPPPTGRVEICCFGRRMHADACARARKNSGAITPTNARPIRSVRHPQPRTHIDGAVRTTRKITAFPHPKKRVSWGP